VVVVGPSVMVPTGWPPLVGQLPLPIVETWAEPPVMPPALVQLPSFGTVRVVVLMHRASVNTVVVPVQLPMPAPHAQGEQLRVSVTELSKVCLLVKPVGQPMSPDAQTQAPETKGVGGTGAQTCPALQPVAFDPPEQASPARVQSGGGNVGDPPLGVHAPATAAVGAAAV